MAVKRPDKHRMFKYITLTPKAFARGGTSNAYLIRFMEASVMFRDFDEPFRRFMELWQFREISKSNGLRIKGQNSIVANAA